MWSWSAICLPKSMGEVLYIETLAGKAEKERVGVQPSLALRGELSERWELRTFARRAVAAEMELMEMSCRRPGEAWSLPAIAARVLAFSARRNGAKKLSRCGDRFRQQAV
jgi:hypothetical protein